MTPEEQNVRALHLPMGRRVGAYEVLGLIGVGGMGEVYRARDTRLRRDVALKTLPAVVASDPRWLELFRREARTERLNPVMMTALTAGLALLPLALSAGEPGNEIQRPLAIVVLGGLLTSVALNMIVVPALYFRWGRASAGAP